MSFLFFFIPIFVWFLYDRRLRKSDTILAWSGFKYLIVVSTYIGIAVTCVTLTFHAVLLMVLPGIFAAQYQNQKKLMLLVVLSSLLLVPVGVYGGFFFGVVDLNLFSGLAEKGVLPLHDIGKIAIPDAILLKPGKLTPEEFDVIKEHTTKGGAMNRSLFSDLEDNLFLHLAEEITLYHHEWWDGTGYHKGSAENHRKTE